MNRNKSVLVAMSGCDQRTEGGYDLEAVEELLSAIRGANDTIKFALETKARGIKHAVSRLGDSEFVYHLVQQAEGEGPRYEEESQAKDAVRAAARMRDAARRESAACETSGIAGRASAAISPLEIRLEKDGRPSLECVNEILDQVPDWTAVPKCKRERLTRSLQTRLVKGGWQCGTRAAIRASGRGIDRTEREPGLIVHVSDSMVWIMLDKDRTIMMRTKENCEQNGWATNWPRQRLGCPPVLGCDHYERGVFWLKD